MREGERDGEQEHEVLRETMEMMEKGERDDGSQDFCLRNQAPHDSAVPEPCPLWG
jgi:hypothetical protein